MILPTRNEFQSSLSNNKKIVFFFQKIFQVQKKKFIEDFFFFCLKSSETSKKSISENGHFWGGGGEVCQSSIRTDPDFSDYSKYPNSKPLFFWGVHFACAVPVVRSNDPVRLQTWPFFNYFHQQKILNLAPDLTEKVKKYLMAEQNKSQVTWTKF